MDPLPTGRVEVDETYLGGLEEGLRGRLVEKKALIVIAAQEDGKGIGRIRLRQIPDASTHLCSTPSSRAAWSIQMAGVATPV